MSEPYWIDAHCHLADPRFEGKLKDILARSHKAGVGGWVQGGVSPGDWERQREIQREFGQAIVLAFGLHPWWVAEHEAEDIEAALNVLRETLSLAKACGELGLDFGPKYDGMESRTRQEEAFCEQLRLAKAMKKPLILHIVKAHGEALRILKREGLGSLGGIVHSFSASQDIAKQYLDLGLTLSISGAITREGFQNLKKAIKWAPSESFVVETDCPDQKPGASAEPGLNEPMNLIAIATAIAGLRGERKDEVLTRSTQTIKRIFAI